MSEVLKFKSIIIVIMSTNNNDLRKLLKFVKFNF